MKKEMRLKAERFEECGVFALFDPWIEKLEAMGTFSPMCSSHP